MTTSRPASRNRARSQSAGRRSSSLHSRPSGILLRELNAADDTESGEDDTLTSICSVQPSQTVGEAKRAAAQGLGDDVEIEDMTLAFIHQLLLDSKPNRLWNISTILTTRQR